MIISHHDTREGKRQGTRKSPRSQLLVGNVPAAMYRYYYDIIHPDAICPDGYFWEKISFPKTRCSPKRREKTVTTTVSTSLLFTVTIYIIKENAKLPLSLISLSSSQLYQEAAYHIERFASNCSQFKLASASEGRRKLPRNIIIVLHVMY